MKRFILAPEPAPWVTELLRSDWGAETVVYAPWALPEFPLTAALPQSLRAALRRRSVGMRGVKFVPGFPLLDAMVRRRNAATSLTWRLWLRRLLDEWVARQVVSAVDEVIAPSLCALRTFAAAPKARRLLIEDLPGLRQLHADLDTASRGLPQCRFLSNFRAADDFVIRQEQEYVLASQVRVQSRFAVERVLRAGVEEAKVERSLPTEPRPAPTLAFDPGSPFVLLAGTTATRFGLEVALEAVRQHSELTLLCRPGEGSCAATAVPQPQLRPVPSAIPAIRAVLAPAWVECSPPEVNAAVSAGVPIIATRRALGWHAPSDRVFEVPPGDAAAISRAVTERWGVGGDRHAG